MIELIKKNQKILARFFGILLMLLSLSLIFWNNQRTQVVTEAMRAQANVERMEAHVKTKTTGSKKASSTADILKELKQKQKDQLQVLLIVMTLFGMAFSGYGFIKKD